jgi:cobalt-zinc-cadmium resistance protein CzcA
MLDKIIRFSIDNKIIIGLLTFALILWGGYSVTQLPIDAVPDITNNQVQIITSAPSQSAQDIERLVTFPVEQAMATIPGIEEVRSFSRFGLSVVTVVFKDNVDVYWARQQVGERLNDAKGQIPEGVGTPEMAPVTTGLGEIYQYILRPKKGYESTYSAMELRTLQDWIVRRQLLGVEGVADVSSFGGYLKQYEIALNPERLRSMNISIADVFTALKKNNQNTGGAYIEKQPNSYFIRSEGLIGSLADIENIAVKTNTNGTPVLIRDVGTIQFSHAVRYGAMTYNAEGEVVGGLVLMLKGANSSKVIANVKTRIAQIEKSLPVGVTLDPFLDRTKLVDRSINTVTKNLAEGALIVIFVLVLLLGNMRAGLIVASVIPLAMLFAIALMNLFGVSGNLMSLGAIDFGLIIDGAVIIVEATLHHLSLRNVNRRLSQTEMDNEVFISASKIRNSAAFGEIIILIVYLPILALVGIEGKMFRPMAQTVGFAILGAFILSLTYVPMVSALFLNKHQVHKVTISDRIIAFFQRLYTPILLFALKRKLLVVGVSLALLIGSILVFNTLGAEFIPTLDEGDFAVETRVLTGSSLSQTVDAAQKASAVLLKNFPEVKEVVGKIGSSEIPTDPMPVEACDLMIILKNKDEWTSADTRDELAEKMQKALEDEIPGVTFGFQQPIQMRFNELMTGARQDVVVKVFGEDLDSLASYADKIGRIINSVEGAKDVYVEQATGLPQIVVNYDRANIARLGMNIEDVNTVINTAYAGKSAGIVYEGERRFDLMVRVAEEYRKDIENIRDVYVTAPDGRQVPLQQLATIEYKVGPNQIQRDDAKRRIIIGFNVRGRDVESIVKELQDKIDKQVKFAPGYYPTYGGTFKNLQEARARLSIAVPVALALIFILLFFTFNSFKQSILIFTAIPLSAIGGIFALWVRDMPFSISAGVGFIALFGVAVLNGIVLISEFNFLKKSGLTDLKEIILKGTQTRLRPVIMTAAVASLGFLPMALSTSGGAEVQRPLATVVIGGLITATLLTLLILPCLYILFEKLTFRRMKPNTLTLLVLGLFLLPLASQAQTPTLTLNDAISLAKKGNLQIQSTNLDVTYSQQIKKTAFEIPKLDVSLMYGQYNSIARNDNNITISQTIPFPTLMTSKSALGASMVKGNELKKEVTENDVIYKVKQTYWTLSYLYSKQRLLLQQDSLYKALAYSADMRFKAGDGRLLDKTNADTQVGEVANLLALNNADIAILTNYLSVLLNMGGSIQIADTVLIEKPFSLPLDTSTIQANPMLAYMKQQVEISQKEKAVDVNSLLPDLRVGYFNQTLIGFQNINGQETYYGPNKRFQGFQVGISIPLFFNGDVAKIKAAGITKLKAEANYTATENTLSGQFKQDVQEYIKFKNTLTYYKTTALPNANLIIEQSTKALQAGEISALEHLLNLRNALDIKKGYLDMVNGFNQAVLNLEYLTGVKN